MTGTTLQNSGARLLEMFSFWKTSFGLALAWLSAIVSSQFDGSVLLALVALVSVDTGYGLYGAWRDRELSGPGLAQVLEKVIAYGTAVFVVGLLGSARLAGYEGVGAQAWSIVIDGLASLTAGSMLAAESISILQHVRRIFGPRFPVIDALLGRLQRDLSPLPDLRAGGTLQPKDKTDEGGIE